MEKKFRNLEEKIKDKIYQDGLITIEEYMTLCLQDEDFGYYKYKRPIGADRDFITAPEVSQMFGEMIAIWLITAWQNIGKQKINIIELGPGNGLMMNDIHRVSKKFPDFYKSINIWLYDTNETLKEEQSRNIDYNFKRVSTLKKMPDGINFFIANEFFDAIPIKQYIRDADNWKERAIDLDDLGQFTYSVIDKQKGQSIDLDFQEHELNDDKVYEISPKQDDILKIIFENISKNGGLLILDYAKIRGGGGDTMQAISAHKKRSIFYEPGKTDLTSLIDIKRYQEIARTMNINSFGPINQSDFLLSLGIFERYKILRLNASDEFKNKLDRQYHRLTDPDKMGKLFKVLYFSNNNSTVPEKMK